MNTVAVGDSLETKIFSLFESEIRNNRFWAKQECCKIFRKKGYYSRDRQTNIVFDVVIEIYLPGSRDFSMLMVIECKNYSHSVPVDDAEEFFAKLQQISGANVKGVIASTNSFQEGTRNFSKSKGMGLLRYFDKTNFKWELTRSPSAGFRTPSEDNAHAIADGIGRQEFQSQVFDLYGQALTRLTNSLWDFFEDFVSDCLSEQDVTEVAQARSRLASQVKFLEKEEIEGLSAAALTAIDYVRGEVSLTRICERERKLRGLSVVYCDRPNSIPANNVLGRIVFSPLEIHLFERNSPYPARERFTLAHELGHHLLGHGNYLSQEVCQESDFEPEAGTTIQVVDIQRMEFQANYFASSLLMPRAQFVTDFFLLVARLGISDKGFGALYVDNQPCNLQSYHSVTNSLMRVYGVSRSAAAHRLESLGLLNDKRDKTV
jgi:hypothetical protein